MADPRLVQALMGNSYAYASPQGNTHPENPLNSDNIPQDWDLRDRNEQNKWRIQRGLPPIPDPWKNVPAPAPGNKIGQP